MPLPTLTDVENTLCPVFDRIFEKAFGEGDPHESSVGYMEAMEVYTITYNFVTKRKDRSSTAKEDQASKPGADLYQFIDQYFHNKSKAIADSCPTVNKDDIINYILDQFRRYHTAARMISSLIKYLDRHYVQRRTDEGAGWLGLPITSSEYITREEDELRRWGYDGNEDGVKKVDALASAQAASSAERLIPVYPLALRQFRVSVIEPLVLDSKDMMDWVDDNIIVTPRGGGDEESVISSDFKAMFRQVGIHAERYYV